MRFNVGCFHNIEFLKLNFEYFQSRVDIHSLRFAFNNYATVVKVEIVFCSFEIVSSSNKRIITKIIINCYLAECCVTF